ncbi:acyl-CoA reductase-like NAD-dependent aldehyde dehydrogenase [Rhizobium aquaticum]|uniref:Acyl-CoA reductase-like NAD-dependent aldehyde dehydrogenase n=1 Tax=Rhizobium aquaticum TaxID=1549636 RepID=A0ABV2J663_9HYPH
MDNIQLLIDNEDRAALAGGTYERLDLVTGAVATKAAAGQPADANAAAAAAAAAFPLWSATGPGERRKPLLKAADIMDSKAGEFTRLMTAETGATAPWGSFNTMFAANVLREAAAMTTQIAGEIIPSDKPGTLAMGVRQAAGGCVGIALWNAPVIFCTRAIARLRQHGHPQGV